MDHQCTSNHSRKRITHSCGVGWTVFNHSYPLVTVCVSPLHPFIRSKPLMEKSHGSACLAGWTPTSTDTLVSGKSTRLDRCSTRLFFYTSFEDVVSRMLSDQILIGCLFFSLFLFGETPT